MKNLITALALGLFALPQAFALAPPKPAKPVFVLTNSNAFSPVVTQLQIHTNGSVRLIETNHENGENSEVEIARLDGRGTREVIRAVALVKPEMDFRALTEQEKRLNESCAMDSSISYWVLGSQFESGQKAVIRNLGCGLSISLADEQAALAMDKLAAIVDQAYEAYLEKQRPQE